MIVNIIDHRKKPHRWKSIQGIVEAIWHDNACEDADQAVVGGENSPDYVSYDMRDGVSVADAVTWASSLNCPVTLYLYDEGTN